MSAIKLKRASDTAINLQTQDLDSGNVFRLRELIDKKKDFSNMTFDGSIEVAEV